MVMHPRVQFALVLLIGAMGGGAGGLDVLAQNAAAAPVDGAAVGAHVAWGVAAGAGVAALVRLITMRAARAVLSDRAACARFGRLDVLTYLPMLVTFLGAWGVLMAGAVISLSVLAAITAKAWLLYAALSAGRRDEALRSAGYLAFLFLISGFAALIYQIVWQRALFTAFGVNIESITIIVSLFMFGLGLGALVGGLLSRRYPDRAPLMFLACEVATGVFGIASVWLIRVVSGLTVHASLPLVGLAVFGLLLVPTGLMGATLPMLCGHLYQHYRNVGKSVGLLYCINTLGSAAACFITADVLFVVGGQQAAVIVAAACNFLVGILTSGYAARTAERSGAGPVAPPAEALAPQGRAVAAAAERGS